MENNLCRHAKLREWKNLVNGYWSQRQKLTVGVLSILLVITWCFIGIRASNVHRYQKQAQNYAQQTASIKAAIATKQERLKQVANRQATHSSNEKIKTSASQVEATDQANRRAQKLFSILLTFNNSTDYSKRKSLAKAYVSSNILNDQKLFGSDDDGTGNSYIDTSGLHSRFSSAVFSAGVLQNNELPVVIKTTSESWFKNDLHAQNEDVYSGTYNYKQKKFTQLTKQSNLTQTVLNNDNN